ncbi:MAG: hypothetical protein M3Z17_05155 [Gemmatimonadota bacterium]|nr:hypothetical protein [Gemmatimonadota bacterium]
MIAGIAYFLFALVAIVAAYRAGSAGGGKQRLGMSAAAIGFLLLGTEYYIPPLDEPVLPMLAAAGVLLVLGVLLYWWGHLHN